MDGEFHVKVYICCHAKISLLPKIFSLNYVTDHRNDVANGKACT